MSNRVLYHPDPFQGTSRPSEPPKTLCYAARPASPKAPRTVKDVVILSALRSPIGAFQGAFKDIPATELGAQVLSGAIDASGLTAADIQQVNMGCVLPAGLGQAPARQVALGAGCPNSTGAVTLNKVCGSGMRAVMMAANDVRCGDYSVVAAGGMESMSRSPFLLPAARQGLRLGDKELVDSIVHDGLWDPYNDVHMGNCAEICAERYRFSRRQQDEYALTSYRRAQAACESGVLAKEIVPIETPKGTIDRDEDPFRVDLERIAKLRPAFQSEGSVTAGNASNIDDGAAVLVLAGEDRAGGLGLTPRAVLRAQASVAQEPEWFTTAPVAAVRAALARADLQIADVDLWEINEAFAVVALACMQELELDPAKGQRPRRCGSARTSHRGIGRADHRHAAERHGADRRPHRLRGDLHRRRRSHRGRHRAARVAGLAEAACVHHGSLVGTRTDLAARREHLDREGQPALLAGLETRLDRHLLAAHGGATVTDVDVGTDGRLPLVQVRHDSAEARALDQAEHRRRGQHLYG